MIGKIAPKGRGFRGLSAYLLRRGRGRIVAGVMAGRTPRELASEFGILRRLNPKLTKAVAHLMLSPSPEDPALTDEQWHSIAVGYIDAMGFADAPWIAVVHEDTDHQHMHLMASRIGFDGKTISDANDFRKSESIVRKIEKEFGLSATPSPAGFKPTSTASSTKHNDKEAAIQGEQRMTDNIAPPNPFNPTDPQHERSPQPIEPGQVLAELAIINTSPSIIMPGASVAEPLTKKQSQKMRRAIVEDDYSERMFGTLGEDLVRVHRYTGGAMLYFKQQGQISDQGCKLIVLGGMDEKLAALRIVALACERGWQSIQFTGSGSFVELAMREALKQRLRVIATDPRQEFILAKILAERQGGMGATALPAGAVPASADLPAILAELDDLAEPLAQRRPELATPQISTLRTTPPAMPALPAIPVEPKQSPVGVLPIFLNLRERLYHQRTHVASTTLVQKNGPPVNRPGQPKP